MTPGQSTSNMKELRSGRSGFCSSWPQPNRSSEGPESTLARTTPPETPGEHAAPWDDVVERFCWNERRRRLIDGLADAITNRADAGCQRVWLNGSFVSTKHEPVDFDACWDTSGVEFDLLDPVLLDLSNS